MEVGKVYNRSMTSSSSDVVTIHLFAQPIVVDLQVEGDRLLNGIQAYLLRNVESTGSRCSVESLESFEDYRYVKCRIDSEVLTSSLMIVPVKEGFEFFVEVAVKDISEPQIELWRTAILSAMDSLQVEQSDHIWLAVIGQVEHSAVKAQVLSAGISIDGITIEPATTCFVDIETDFIHSPDLTSRGLVHSFPVHVRGTAKGFDWNSASRSAAQDINAICALLSIAFDARWDVRQAPLNTDSKLRGLPAARVREDDSMADETNFDSETVSIPDWFGDGLSRMRESEVLATAVHSHHHALRLESASPSYALVAYVATIEGLGPKLQKAEVCDCCEKCDAVKDSGKRFRDALKLIYSGSQVKKLWKSYTYRSKTAHSGQMHGGEAAIGDRYHGGFFSPPPEHDDFRHMLLRQMRKACRELLVHHLQVERSPIQ